MMQLQDSSCVAAHHGFATGTLMRAHCCMVSALSTAPAAVAVTACVDHYDVQNMLPAQQALPNRFTTTRSDPAG